MKLPKQKFQAISRESAMSARPQRATALRAEKTADGGLNVTMRMVRPSWMRRLGATQEFERTFSLDYLGREVYEACDGQTEVRAIIETFSVAHKVSVAEAEMSVSAFLKTLMGRGLVVMVLDTAPTAVEKP